jgi:hypothetical protein
MNLLLEEIREQNRATIEAVLSSRQEIMRELGGRIDVLSRRIDALELAVRINSEDIRKNSEDIRKNSEDIAALHERLSRVEESLRRRPDEAAIQDLQVRVEALERRLGI